MFRTGRKYCYRFYEIDLAIIFQIIFTSARTFLNKSATFKNVIDDMDS